MKKEKYIKVYCCTDTLVCSETYYYIFSTTFNLKELKEKEDDIIDALRDKYDKLFYDIEFKVTKNEVEEFLKFTDYNYDIENIDEILMEC
jgi:hypothetical protein